MVNLPSCNIDGILNQCIILDLYSDDLQSVREGCEWVAKFMGEHGQELVLSPSFCLQVFRLREKLHFHALSDGNVRNQADCTLYRAFSVPQRVDSDVKPVGTQRAVGGLAGTGFEHSREQRLVAFGCPIPQGHKVVADDFRPASAEDTLNCAIGLYHFARSI